MQTLTCTVKEKDIHVKVMTHEGSALATLATVVAVNGDRSIRISLIKAFMQYKARIVSAKDEQYIYNIPPYIDVFYHDVH